MVATVARWGNSLAVRIPQNLAKEIHLAEGVEVDLVVIDGNLVIRPRSRKRYSLDELIDAIKPENRHTETGRSDGSRSSHPYLFRIDSADCYSHPNL